jgi:hypothetical protein
MKSTLSTWTCPKLPLLLALSSFLLTSDKERAFESLEKAYEDRSIVTVGYIKTNPMFHPLRSGLRFA